MVSNQVIEVETKAAAVDPQSRMGLSRYAIFGAFLIVLMVAFWGPLDALVSLSLHDEEYSYIVLVPLLSIALMYVKKGKIFEKVYYSFGIGGLVLLAGLVLELLSAELSSQLSPEIRLFVSIISFVTLSIAGFILCFGKDASIAGAFPLMVGFLFVPVPRFLMDRPIFAVQQGSAEVAYVLFRLARVAVFRDGTRFALPGLNIEVTKHCSGIHSTLALFIFSLVVGHFCLKSLWKRFFLILSIIPVVCFTNGLRIFGVSMLSIYVDRRFIAGDLHRNGGSIFFLLGLIIVVLLIRLMRRRSPSSAATSCVSP